MIKRVEFGINESSKENRLSSGWDKLDLNNGVGEFLGVVSIGNKNLMITLNESVIDFDKRYTSGKIKVNEIEYDSYQDGSIAVYYNVDKCQEALLLEEKLNSDLIKKMIESGESIYDILNLPEIKLNQNLEKRIINEFSITPDYIYPKDYDFAKSAQLGPNYEKRREIKETKIENLIVTGISKKLFDNLKESKKNHMSTYQMTKYIERLQDELRNSRDISNNSYGR